MTEQELRKAFEAGYKKYKVNKPITSNDDTSSYEFDYALSVGDIVEVIELKTDTSVYPVKCRYSDDEIIFLNYDELEIADDVLENELLNKHYARNDIQPIEFIQQVLRTNPNVNPFEGACLKDIIKYSSRYGLKDAKINEAKKIVDYALWLLLEAMDIKVDPTQHNHANILKGFDL